MPGKVDIGERRYPKPFSVFGTNSDSAEQKNELEEPEAGLKKNEQRLDDRMKINQGLPSGSALNLARALKNTEFDCDQMNTKSLEEIIPGPYSDSSGSDLEVVETLEKAEFDCVYSMSLGGLLLVRSLSYDGRKTSHFRARKKGHNYSK